MKKLFLSTIALIGFAVITNAQVSATATATATIVSPITITKNVDMNFGNIAVAATGGEVVLAPETGVAGRTTTGGVTLPATVGTVTAAKFTIGGAANYSFAITVPSTTVVLTRNSGSETMNATNFTSDLGATSTLDGTGAKVLYVGAKLTVANNQVAGTYVTGTAFTVTVNYN